MPEKIPKYRVAVRQSSIATALFKHAFGNHFVLRFDIFGALPNGSPFSDGNF